MPRDRSRLNCCHVFDGTETPCLRAVFAHHVIADANTGPIEVAVVTEASTCLCQLGQQPTLCGSGHAVGADHWSTAWPQPVRSDRNQIGVFADIDVSACYGPTGG